MKELKVSYKITTQATSTYGGTVKCDYTGSYSINESSPINWNALHQFLVQIRGTYSMCEKDILNQPEVILNYGENTTIVYLPEVGNTVETLNYEIVQLMKTAEAEQEVPVIA